MIHWLPAVFWMGFIFFLSGRHSVTVSEEYLLNFLFFKTLHMIEYAVLFVLYSRAVHLSSQRMGTESVYRTAFLLTLLYAASDETHQLFIPSREGTLRDVIIDGIGAGFVWYFLSALLRKAQPKLKVWAKQLGLPS